MLILTVEILDEDEVDEQSLESKSCLRSFNLLSAKE